MKQLLFLALLLCLATSALSAEPFAVPSAYCPNAWSAKSNESLLRRAEAGSLAAQYQLACRYLFIPTMRNGQDAWFWMHSAADLGYVDARFMFAYMAHEGIGMAKNPESSLLWLELAAKNGSADAHKVLAGQSYDQVLARH